MITVRNGAAPRRARLAALGHHVPERVVTNADLERQVDTTDEWIVSRTGIRERRYAAADEASSDLAFVAGQDILARAGVDAADLDLVIVPTATPDHLFPSTAALVTHRLGAVNAAAYDLMAGCTGFLYGLAQGCAMVESGLARNALVVGAETLTRIMDHTDRATCVLFGDAAAGALLVGADADGCTGFLGFELGTDGGGGSLLVLPAGGSRMPPGQVLDDPRDAYLRMNGREVFKFASRVMEESVLRLLERLEMGVDEIDLLVAHQANQRIIEHALRRLDIPQERVFNNLERYGNTSSASIPLALCEARDLGRLRPGDMVLMVGFGAGLSWGSTVVRYEPT